MRGAGIDVLSLAAGEPDFNTPEPICEAAIQGLRDGFTKYTPSTGIKPLKEAIVEKLRRDNGLSYTPEQIVATCGAKQALYNTMMVLLDPGDEVLLLAPYWMTYADQVLLAGGTPVVVPTLAEDGFAPDLDTLKAAITPRTKMIVVNSPCNPTGAILPRRVLKEIAALALRHGFWVVSDEIYDQLVYDGARAESMAGLGREIAERTVTIGGCSKSYAMTGWRIGFAAAPLAVVKAMGCLQDQVTSNPTSFAQLGAIEAFRMEPSGIEAMRAEFEARRNLVLDRLRAIPQVSIVPPQGAFYAFADVSPYLGGTFRTDFDLAEHLLEHAHLAVIPGSVFEGPGHIRLSYAAGRDQIEEGVARLARVLAEIKG